MCNNNKKHVHSDVAPKRTSKQLLDAMEAIKVKYLDIPRDTLEYEMCLGKEGYWPLLLELGKLEGWEVGKN